MIHNSPCFLQIMAEKEKSEEVEAENSDENLDETEDISYKDIFEKNRGPKNFKIQIFVLDLPQIPN